MKPLHESRPGNFIPEDITGAESQNDRGSLGRALINGFNAVGQFYRQLYRDMLNEIDQPEVKTPEEQAK